MSKAQEKLLQLMTNQGNQETGRNADGTYKKGCSGNPAGRPKRSEQEKEVIKAMGELAPKAVSILQSMLTNESTPAYLRLRAAEIVFDRVCGKPMTSQELEQQEKEEELDDMFGFTLNL